MIPNQKAKTVARVSVAEFICRYLVRNLFSFVLTRRPGLGNFESVLILSEKLLRCIRDKKNILSSPRSRCMVEGIDCTNPKYPSLFHYLSAFCQLIHHRDYRDERITSNINSILFSSWFLRIIFNVECLFLKNAVSCTRMRIWAAYTYNLSKDRTIAVHKFLPCPLWFFYRSWLDLRQSLCCAPSFQYTRITYLPYNKTIYRRV